MKILLAIAISLLLLLNPSAYAYAAESQTARLEEELCPFVDVDIEEYGGAILENPDELSGDTLTVDYIDTEIADCLVHLRSYRDPSNEDELDEKPKLVGPTIRVHPGDTLHLNLINKLSPEDFQGETPQYIEDAAVGNLQDDDQCEYVEPPAGGTTINGPQHFNTTNFHTHGLHVDPNGCSDNVLRVMNPSPNAYEINIEIPEDHTSGTFWYHAHLHGSTALQVSSGMAGALIIEPKEVDINPSNIQTLDDIPAIFNAREKEKIFVLQQISHDENGIIENYNHFGVGKWKDLNRHTTINGQIVPVIKMHPGEVQRWRFIHAGVRETISLEVRGNRMQIPLYEIAVDGIPLGDLDIWDSSTIDLQPGYRSDVLFRAPNIEGLHEYVLNDKAIPSEKSLTGDDEPGHILAKVIVGGAPMNMELPSDDQLALAKKNDAPADIETAIAGSQNLTFNLELIDPEHPDTSPKRFAIDNQPFDLANPPRTLDLNGTDIWNLSVSEATIDKAPNHPFHIHVNPFQYVRQGPNGDELIWRDTLLVTKDEPKEIYARYDDFTGRFVLHCHILDHEDNGMMQVVEITNEPAI